MSAGRVALIAAVCAVVTWTAKAVAIGLAGGLDESPAEGPLFLLGLLAAAVGAAALGAALAVGRSVAVRAIAGVAGVVTLLLVIIGGGAVAGAVQPADPSWVWAEVNLWVAALLLLGAANGAQARHRAHPLSSPVR